MRTALLPCFLLAIAVPRQAHAATFTITHFDTPPDAQVAIDYAANIWGSILESEVPIKVSVAWVNMGTATLGITFPNGRKDFPGAPVPSTWYATALANSINGNELNPGEDDINIYLNSSTNWYMGTDGSTPAAQYDLVSVALHEFGHGLGFVGLAKKEGTVGSFGLLQASDFAPLITTFPWPDQDTLPGIFDRYLKNQLDEGLTNAENPSTFLGSAFTSNQIYWNGPIALEANGDNAIRIYAPTTFALGSSCVHLNEGSYPAGNPNELMTPFSGAGDANHWPGPICIGMLRDIGWQVQPWVGISEAPREMAQLRVYPNPSSDVITLSSTGHSVNTIIRITDVSGREVLAASDRSSVDVSTLATGTYTMTRITTEGRSYASFIKE